MSDVLAILDDGPRDETVMSVARSLGGPWRADVVQAVVKDQESREVATALEDPQTVAG